MALSLNGSARGDETLMARVRDDDVDAFAQLYDRHAGRAFRVAQAVCSDTGRAEDAVQEGFLTIWRERASYRPELGTFQAWAMKIVQNRAIDSYRRAARRPPVQRGDQTDAPADSDDRADVPHVDVIARSESEALRATLKTLPEAQAKVIVLAFFGDLSHSEIASQLNLPAGTVKGRMRLGLEKLRRQIGASVDPV